MAEEHRERTKSRHQQRMRRPTLDEELLLWLDGEAPEVRAADADRVRDIAEEFAAGFRALSRVERAVTVFGSARTPAGHAHHELARALGAALGRDLALINVAETPEQACEKVRGAHERAVAEGPQIMRRTAPPDGEMPR